MAFSPPENALDAIENKISSYLEDGEMVKAFKEYWYNLGNHHRLGNVKGEYRRGERVTRLLLNADDQGGRTLDPHNRSVLESDHALFLIALGQHNEAVGIYKAQLQVFSDPSKELCQLMANISEVEFFRGALPASIASARRGMEASSVRAKLYFVTCNLGIACFYSGLLKDGVNAFIECRLTLPNKRDNLWASAGRKLHLSLLRAGRSCDLEQLLPDAYRYNRSRGFAKEIAYTDIIRAEMLRKKLRFDEAFRALEDGEKWGKPRSCMEVMGLSQLFHACLLRDTDDPEKARTAAETGLRYTKRYPLLQVDFLNLLARIALDVGDEEAVRKYTSESLRIAESDDCKYFWGIKDAYMILCNFHKTIGQQRESSKYQNRIKSLKRRSHIPDEWLEPLLTEKAPSNELLDGASPTLYSRQQPARDLKKLRDNLEVIDVKNYTKQSKKNSLQSMKNLNMIEERRKAVLMNDRSVFVSYTRTEDEYMNWVKMLVDDLKDFNFDVVFDQYENPRPKPPGVDSTALEKLHYNGGEIAEGYLRELQRPITFFRGGVSRPSPKLPEIPLTSDWKNYLNNIYPFIRLINICHKIVIVITLRYIEEASSRRRGTFSAGWIWEEFRLLDIRLNNAPGELLPRVVVVLKEGENYRPNRWKFPMLDFRDGNKYSDKIKLLKDYLETGDLSVIDNPDPWRMYIR